MNIKLMKLELKNLSLYSNNALEIDFFAEKEYMNMKKIILWCLIYLIISIN